MTTARARPPSKNEHREKHRSSAFTVREELKHFYDETLKDIDVDSVQGYLEDSLLQADSPLASIQIHGITVPIRDLQNAVNAVILQQRFLEYINQEGVFGVQLSTAAGDYFVPIDFRLKHIIPNAEEFDYSRSGDFSEVAGPLHEHVGRTLSHIAHHTNLSPSTRSADDGMRSFFRRLTETFLSRWNWAAYTSGNDSTNGGSGDPPPGAMISVETERPGQLVMYSKAYFFSTSDTFEYSTPARRWLPNG
jgi:hypothetical protein